MEYAYQFVQEVTEGAICTITINRPDVLNALNADVLRELGDCIFNLDPGVRVVILEGSGDKAFVAGADIGPMAEMDPSEALEFSQLGQMVCQSFEQAPQIFIVKVQGFALGGGCELAMAGDIIIAGETAKFGQPEVGLGLIPGFGGTQRLVKRVGLPVALDMLCCGSMRTLTAQEAFQLGLVSRVVPDEDLEATVARVAGSILKGGPRAVSQVKKLCRQAAEMNLASGLDYESNAFACCFADQEAREGLEAFLQKRKPSF